MLAHLGEDNKMAKFCCVAIISCLNLRQRYCICFLLSCLKFVILHGYVMLLPWSWRQKTSPKRCYLSKYTSDIRRP